MRVLAIDPSSTNTGWCIWDGVMSNHWSSQYKQELHADKFGHFLSDIRDAILRHAPTVVAFERASKLRSENANAIIVGMAAVVQAAAFDDGLPSMPVHNETIKAHSGVSKLKSFGGRKKTSQERNQARKERLAALVSAAHAMGFPVNNDDEAVAAIMADYVLRHAVIGAAVAKAEGQAA